MSNVYSQKLEQNASKEKTWVFIFLNLHSTLSKENKLLCYLQTITNRNGYIFHHVTYLYHQISVMDYSFFCFPFSCTQIVKIKAIFQVCNSMCKMYIMSQFKWNWNYVNFRLCFFFWEVHVHTMHINYFCKGSDHLACVVSKTKIWWILEKQKRMTKLLFLLRC